MTIDELITKLQEVREELGGDAPAFSYYDDFEAYEVSGVTVRTYGKKTIDVLVFDKIVPITNYVHCDGHCDGKCWQEHIRGVEVAPW